MGLKTPDVKEPLATFKQRALAGLVPDFSTHPINYKW